MSTRQGNRFSSRTKGGGRFNFCFAQSGVRGNIGKHKDQGNAAVHVDVVTGKMV